MLTRSFFLGAMGAIAAGVSAQQPRAWLPATAEKLPLWRGFNLTNKFHLEWSNGPFEEEDFRLISELGFNFVRLPMDYRTWVADGDWRRLNEATLADIDQAVEWGKQYGIHVSINFHRAPGYTVASPKERTDLWTDEETQAVCALHWGMFAKRYKGIPNERLSFNLFNEPSHIPGEAYYRVAKQVVEAIRAEDPQRLIIADGLQWGSQPCRELFPLRIAQATRGYAPSYVSHYKASWAGTWEGVPPPTWPRPLAVGWLAGDGKKELQTPLVIRGPFAQDSILRFRVGVVSAKAHVVLSADGRVVFDRTYVPADGEGDWSKVVFKPEWNVYQNVYNRDYEAPIPAGTKQAVLAVQEGDWMTLTELGVRRDADGADEAVITLLTDYGKAAEPIHYQPDVPAQPLAATNWHDRAWLWREQIQPWEEARKAGVGVMVGEFGAFQHTPHDVVLRWMEDCLANWRRAGWGWAMWNFRGSFGILDSGRQDVAYEEYKGHKLDRRMLDLLFKYR